MDHVELKDFCGIALWVFHDSANRSPAFRIQRGLNDCLELSLLKIRQEWYLLTEQQKDHELHHAAVKYYHLDRSIDFVNWRHFLLFMLCWYGS
ncbi:hypothetical protein KY290_013622 [Solanum tuberosum]|uniref:Uncharacterized protein n=1 Tax=Solanum tuberosum TaxID=4113 RepID=A0ABQ7VM87_SOLTU|nr:hypothetical protein KY290_013622 [Solanum tuberosum]